ncbi:PREDICTED: pro-FMRFamide-related neuropeptide VF [Ceratotherium simum simum]|uniref:Pro-FMRFamide-related neuropeptide VF n=1 Tax=Ceratotherium simum simum TaxID=73337 RepID=A0ABM0H3S7_CERSS|nr:PREDICTED: pro-FMRFamide-related neuropeptide VF [Ceratotherium simum simum]
MEVISSKRLILLILATSSLLTSNIFCADELTMSNVHGKENYDKYSKPRGDPKGEKERSLNFEELKDWGPKNAIKITPSVNKMPHSAANLPLRFGRTTEEERSTGAMANLPLRFGRNTEESISRRVPNLPQRFGRTTAAKSVTKTLSDFLEQSIHSPSANELPYSMSCQPQEIQIPDRKHPRRLGFKKIGDAELKQEK